MSGKDIITSEQSLIFWEKRVCKTMFFVLRESSIEHLHCCTLPWLEESLPGPWHFYKHNPALVLYLGLGFWEDVITVRKDFFRARTANVILALETKSLDPNKVQGQDVRILLTYTGEYSEKVENEHKITPELQTALDKIGKVLS